MQLAHPKYRPDIDGLRSIAVLSVVIYHAFPYKLPGGFIGVDIFFVISGFLVSSIIFGGLNDTTFTFKVFYARRIKRIFPALILLFVAVYSFGWFVLTADEYMQLGKHMAAGVGFVSNFVFLNEAGYFDISSNRKLLLHLWSLGVEEQFYIVWPLLLWLAWKLKINALLIIMLFSSISMYLNVKGIEEDIISTFYLPQMRFWEFLCGSVLALSSIQKWKIISDIPIYVRVILCNISSVLGFLLLCYGFFWINKDVSFHSLWAVAPVFGTVMILLAGPKAKLNRFVLSNRVAVWFGLISYPLYLWHWPLLSFAEVLSLESPSSSLRICLVALSIFFAWITYMAIEAPVRRGNYGRFTTHALVIFVIFLGIIGYSTYAKGGFEFRGIVKYYENFYSPSARQSEKGLIRSYKNYSGNEISKSEKPVVLILGDSYVTNWTVGLSSHIDNDRYDIVSISYLGCMIEFEKGVVYAVASKDEYKNYCQTFQSYINNEYVLNRLSAAILVTHRPFEYQANKFRFDLLRWLYMKNNNSEMFVFGNYFQLDEKAHSSCENLMYRAHRGAEACIELANYPLGKPIISTLPMYPSDLSFEYIDIIDLHCSYDKYGCSTQAKGVPFMSDWNHLSVTFIDSIIHDIKLNKAKELEASGLLKYIIDVD